MKKTPSNPYKGKFNQKEVADKLNVSPVHLNGVLCGRVKPSIVFAINLEKETQGIVKAKDLRPELADVA